MPVAAGIGAAGSIVGGLLGGKGAKKAAKAAARAQQQSAQMAIDQQNRLFDITRADNLPFIQAGQKAVGAEGDLLGLNGGDVQSTAIQGLKDSPLFRSLYDTGEEALLANASATGGLRGGNTQRGLADFGSDTLARVIQQQLSNLGGLRGSGQATGTALGGLSGNNAAQISALLNQQGSAKAGGILANAAINANNTNNVFSSLGSFLGQGGGLSSIFKPGGSIPSSASISNSVNGFVGGYNPSFPGGF
jgi:hypothetical protein